MRFLRPIDVDDLAIYAAAAEGLGEPPLADYEPALNARFDEFDAAVGALRTLVKAGAPLNSIQPELFRLYDSRCKTVKEYKKRIRSSASPGCPYCGENCSLPEVDHYLPRSIFAEYSLFSRNLVPSCGPCNGKFGTKIAKERDFIYPYVDDFLQQAVVQATFDWDATPFSIHLEVRPDIPDVIRLRVEDHLNLFDLRNRFAAFAMSELTRYTRRFGKRSADEIAESLGQDEESYLPEPGPNMWPAVISRAARLDARMLQWIQAEAAEESARKRDAPARAGA